MVTASTTRGFAVRSGNTPLHAATAGRHAVAAKIGEACREHGFFYVTGHGVDEGLQRRLEEAAGTFFALDTGTKVEIGMARGGRAWSGYFPVGGELTSGKPDLKEGVYFGAELPEGYHDVVGEAGKVQAALDRHPTALAPCHCDPLSENFLYNGARMWVVAWEYSGMNDPLWDLGDMSVEAGLDEARDEEIMAAYCDGRVPKALYGRMVIYKAMCDLLWTLWGLIQHANKNPVDDFWAYALNRFTRCKTLMGTADFGRHLNAVAQNLD